MASLIMLILHHISKWFQTNQLLLNMNKTYIVKFTASEAPFFPLNIIHVDQTLAVTEIIKFLSLHLNSHLSGEFHVNVLLKKLSSGCFMMGKLCYILHIDALRIVYFAHFQSLTNCGLILGGSSTTMCNVFLLQKRVIRVMLELGPRSWFRGGFKKLDTVTIPSLYIFALMMFPVRNPDNFQPNSMIRSIDMRQQNQLHLTSVKFSSVQKGVVYSSIKMFNKLL